MQIVSEGRQFARNDKAYFLGKIRKNIVNLSSAELATRLERLTDKSHQVKGDVLSGACSHWIKLQGHFSIHTG